SYTLVMALRAGGDLTEPYISFEVPSGATSVTLTQKQIDDALKAKTVADGVLTELKRSVRANNGSANIVSTSVFNINITRMKDGASPFVLLGPGPSNTPVEINPTSTTESFKFNWTRSKPATGGPAVTYRVLFAERKLDALGNEIPVNWNAPLFSIAADNNGADSLLTLTYKRISDSIAVHGYADVALQANLKWTVQATSGTWKQLADYQNNLFILRQVKFFIVGGVQNPQWDINNPLELIADKKSDRYGKVFFTYVYMTAGTEFKFFKTKGDWGSGYGNNGTSGAGFATGFNVGGNFMAPATGVYRLTIDVGANMAYMQQKQVGVVGNMQGWNPAAPTYGGLVKRDLFLIITSTSGTDPFKFHDGPEWDNSTIDKARWWGANTGSDNLDPDASDIIADHTPRTRLIWDGTNTQQIKYQKNSAAQMRVVGDGDPRARHFHRGSIWDRRGARA
ncbi:MAG: SusF/SusE family outer membrane protein, partial [Pedobacter sp.]